MSSSQSNRVHLIILLGFSLTLLIVVGIPVFIIDTFANEDRSYKLSNEMHALTQELKQYKKQHGAYPKNLSAIRKSDSLCVNHFYTKCRNVFYKPTQNLQNFRMAMYSFTWPILYYHPEISMKPQELSTLSQKEQEIRKKQYGTICFFCVSYPPNRTDLHGSDDSLPIYRKSPPIFANPDEWPEIT